MSSASDLVAMANNSRPADNDRSRERYALMPTIPTPPTREGLLAWLAWNDRHGCYTDYESDHEGVPRLTYGEALDLVEEVLRDSQGSRF